MESSRGFVKWILKYFLFWFGEGSQAFVLFFEFLDAHPHRLECLDQLFFGVAWGDVLWAVPVESFDVNEHGAFGGSFFFRHTQLVDELACFGGTFVNLGATEEFQARLVRVVHEEECYAIFVLEVADADVLLVAAKVGEAESAVVEDVKEAFEASAILDVRPAGFGDRGHVEAVAGFDEGALVGAKTVARIVGALHAFVEMAAAVLFLLLFNKGSEGEFCVASAHGSSTGMPEVI
jgi:hypothetical protein